MLVVLNEVHMIKFIFFILFATQVTFAQSTTQNWKVKKIAWTELDEKSFSEFVALIGQAVEKRECNSLQSCLAHPNNPYRGSDATPIKVHADCAKLAYVMRGYFAWKNNLPFSFSSDIQLRNVSGNNRDLRYSRFGNTITERKNALPVKNGSSYQLQNAISLLTKTVPSEVYSAHYRTLYSEDDLSAALFSDFYSANIDKASIRPGTIIYDPNGHVAIVYKITTAGQIYFIDAHPDNSLTSGLYGTKFIRSNPTHGAGFKNFRSYKLVDSVFDQKLDSHVGGRIIPQKNSEIKNFSAMQYFGTDLTPRPDWQNGPFTYNGQNYPYYEYVRIAMSTGTYKINPMTEMKSLAADLCQSVQDRIDSVNAAVTSKIHLKSHIERLPVNIYGTSGEWEEFSTPSRDARLKTSFKELKDTAKNILQKHETGNPQIDYTGQNIKLDMMNAYLKTAQACQITYTNSQSQSVKLNLEQARGRLFEMSFSPYHCPELRWGATAASELATCKDDTTKLKWHQALKWLRFQIDRRYDVKMDYILSELSNGPLPNVGVAQPPDIDIIKTLSQ